MIGPISVSPETIESTAHSIRAGGGVPLPREMSRPNWGRPSWKTSPLEFSIFTGRPDDDRVRSAFQERGEVSLAVDACYYEPNQRGCLDALAQDLKETRLLAYNHPRLSSSYGGLRLVMNCLSNLVIDAKGSRP